MIYGGYFDPEVTLSKIKELESTMNEPNFWDDKKKSESIIKELNALKNKYERISNLKKHIESNIDILNSLKTDMDNDMFSLISTETEDIKNELDEVEVLELLNGEYDKCDAILEIHPGAGGTESCDWASMLLRMYERYAEKNNFKYEILDYEDGEEAGIKSVSMIIHGTFAYGYLKCEKGVHRLIRISPFDSGARRHTSFASVDVMPYFGDSDINVEINPNDLRIDIFRISGNGGQGVNTTDSAVRILHIPTRIMVTCQDERSQIMNKEKAMKVLKSKLYQLELEKRDAELKKIQGVQKEINFGSQIRSYIMHPYSMVKDHRTNTETSNVSKVLDGDIDMFINDVLKGDING